MGEAMISELDRSLRRANHVRSILKWAIGAPFWFLVLLGVAVLLEFGCGVLEGGGGH